MQSKFLC